METVTLSITRSFALVSVLAALLSAATPASAQVPALLNYQGRVVVNGTNYDGTGQFRFALVNNGGGATFWSNGAAAVSLPVTRGLYSVLLGDTNVANMATLSPAVFTNSDVRLRVWLDGQLLAPDQRIASAGYALNAQTAQGVAAGAITSSMLAAGAVTSVVIADGAIGAADLGSNSVTTAALAQGAVTADRIRQMADVLLSATITNPAPAASDVFGCSVAGVGSNRFVVGAYLDDAGASDAGSVYLYDPSGALIATITNPAPAAADWFGASVAGVGSNRFVVGAHLDDAGATNAGCAYLYDLSGTLITTITNPTPATDDNFGCAVAGVGSNRLVVGARYDDTGATNAGSVYLYDLGGALIATITNPAPEAGDSFGCSVTDIGSSHFVVGADSDDAGATDAGIAYVYDLSGALITTISNPTPAASDFFGISVADVGTNRFVVGAHKDDAGAFDTGAAYLYDLGGALIATLTNPTPAASDFFGRSVAGVGTNRIVVGARYDDTGATNAGCAYLYDLSGTLIATLTNPTPATDDNFGYAVAGFSSSHFVVGSLSDIGASDAGCAYLYEIPGCSHADGVIADAVRPGAISVSMLDTSSVDERYVNTTGDTMTGSLVINTDLTVEGSFQATTTRYIDINCYGTVLGNGASFAHGVGGAITMPNTNFPYVDFTFSIPPDFVPNTALYCDLLWKNTGTNGAVQLQHNYEAIQRDGSLVSSRSEASPGAVSEGTVANYAHTTTITLTNAYQSGDSVIYGFFRQVSDSSTNSIIIGGIRIRYMASR